MANFSVSNLNWLLEGQTINILPGFQTARIVSLGNAPWAMKAHS
jgi:hypothetical protein